MTGVGKLLAGAAPDLVFGGRKRKQLPKTVLLAQKTQQKEKSMAFSNTLVPWTMDLGTGGVAFRAISNWGDSMRDD